MTETESGRERKSVCKRGGGGDRERERERERVRKNREWHQPRAWPNVYTP